MEVTSLATPFMSSVSAPNTRTEHWSIPGTSVVGPREFANWNNLTFSGDVIRRTLMCTMDAGCERPELRDFKTDAASEAKERRGELVVAALTVLRAWHVADERLNLPAFGGFEDWSCRVREALIWLDRTDPCETSVDVRDSDPYRGELVTVVEQWKEHLTLNQDFTVQQVIGRALINSDFHNALMAVASSPSGGSVNLVKLGRWLNRAKGKDRQWSQAFPGRKQARLSPLEAGSGLASGWGWVEILDAYPTREKSGRERK
jgi:putative DNA primase/helicase